MKLAYSSKLIASNFYQKQFDYSTQTNGKNMTSTTIDITTFYIKRYQVSGLGNKNY